MSVIREVTIKAKKYLETPEILIFVGPRQAGKTTILHQLEKEIKDKPYFFLNLEDKEIVNLLNLSPKNIFQVLPLDLKKKTFIFIDEIQYLKDPTNFLKYLYDQYQEKLKLIVSGSSAFYIDRRFKDSLVGRKKIFYVYPASLKEFFAFKGFEFDKPYSKLTLIEKDQYKKLFFEYLVYGGYPRVILSSFEEKKEVLRDLVYSYIKKDVYEGGVRQEDVFYRLLKILASQIGNLVNQFELSLTLGVSKSAVENYLYLMQKSFHLCLIRPFFKNIRKELTKMPKVYFYDLGLRNFLVNNFQPFLMRDDQGTLLENYFFRLFLEEKYPDEIKFWRTTEGQEVDFIIDNTAYEIKVNKKILKPSKYKLFQKKYPQIKLEIVGLEEAMELGKGFG
jgi:predicted AAA+ superfamily ATPase